MIQPTLPLLVYQRKETSMKNTKKLVQNVLVLEVVIEVQDGTQVQIGQEDTPLSTTLVQGVIEIKR